MQNSTASLSAAVTSPHRVIGHTAQVDWDADGYGGDGSTDDISHKMSSVKVAQVLNTTLPEQVRVTPGAAVAQLTAKIEHGNTLSIANTVAYRVAQSNWSGVNELASTATFGPGAGVRPGDLAVAVIAIPNVTTALTQTNVPWTTLASKSVYVQNPVTGAYVTDNILRSLLLVRRITVSEPSSYTFTFANHTVYAAHMIFVANGGAAGVHEYSTLTRDSSQADILNTMIQGRPITTTIDGCTILNFYFTFTSAGSASWSFANPAEQVSDFQQSVHGNTDVAFAATYQNNAPAGTYIPAAQFNHSSQAITFFSVAVAPLLAGDDRQNAAWTYSELNPSSPIAGKQRDARPTTWSVNFATSAGIESVPVFTGLSLGVDISSRARTATLTALDNRELFRSSTFINMWAVALWPRSRPGETQPYYPGLESTSLVSYILGRFDKLSSDYDRYKTIGFYVAPSPRVNEALYVSCHGTMTPFIGDLRFAYTQRADLTQRVVRFDHGPYLAGTEKAPANGSIGAKWNVHASSNLVWSNTGGAGTHYARGRVELCCRYDSLAVTNVTNGFDMQVINEDTASTFVNVFINTAGLLAISVTINGVSQAVGGPAVPQDGLWHKLGCHWNSQTGAVSFYLDGAVTTTALTPVLGTLSGTTTSCQLTARNLTSVSEIHVNGAFSTADVIHGDFTYDGGTTLPVTSSTPWIWDNFTPTAFIDRSTNQLSAGFWDANVDLWTTLTQIAEADFSAVFFDASGLPHFRNGLSDGTTAGQVVQRTLTTTTALKDIDYVANVTMVANYITVPYSGVEFVLDGQPWTPGSPILLPSLQTITFIIQYPGLVSPYDSNSLFLTTDPNTSADGTGATYDRTQFIVITAQTLNYLPMNQIKWSIQNRANVDLWLVDANGSNSVSTISSYVQPSSSGLAPVVAQDLDSQVRHSFQTLAVSSTQWRQSSDSAMTLAQSLISDLAEIKPVLRNVNIVGDPRLQIGDRVQFVDPTGLNVNDTYRLTGITTEAANGGLTQQLTARQSPTVARWGVNRWNDGSIWGSAS